MELARIDDFRRYYNTTINPELRRMERRRRRLLTLIGASIGFLILGIILAFVFDLGAFVLIFSLIAGFYLIYLGYRVNRFRRTFKPRVVQLILDFMNDTLNLRQLRYEAARKLPRERFLQSGLFSTKAPYYTGEDYIEGMVGEMPFELCELSVREISPASNRLQDVFNGVFLYSVFAEESVGSVIVWPRVRAKYLRRSIKEYTWNGGVQADNEIMNPRFRELFTVFAKRGTHVAAILSEPMQEALVGYAELTGKDLYVSFIDRHIYAGVSEERDLLEPDIFRTNESYDLVRGFYTDIALILKVIEVFDQTH
jgi:hypothetical protein